MPPAPCDAFVEQELIVGIIDCVGCTVLSVWTFYMGFSLLMNWQRGDGVALRAKPSRAPHRV